MVVKKLRHLIRAMGFDIVRYQSGVRLPSDMPANLAEIYRDVSSYTMSSPERVYSLCEAVRYIEGGHIDGAIVECGVWKGGSMMAVAKMLLGLNASSRDLYLFDTFEGMSAPTSDDKTFEGVSAETLLADSSFDRESGESVWCRADLKVVQEALFSTGYPREKVHFIKGKVEDTLPGFAPDKIALLRLDTDWYESTRHEMEHLFPRLAKGGVLIVDDYGHWRGAKKAIDEYIETQGLRVLLNRIDYTGRIAVKIDE